MMKTKRLDSFLWCFQLETGGLFIGWMGIVSSLLAILICSLMIVGFTQGMANDETLQSMGFGNPEVIDEDQMNMIRTS